MVPLRPTFAAHSPLSSPLTSTRSPPLFPFTKVVDLFLIPLNKGKTVYHPPLKDKFSSPVISPPFPSSSLVPSDEYSLPKVLRGQSNPNSSQLQFSLLCTNDRQARYACTRSVCNQFRVFAFAILCACVFARDSNIYWTTPYDTTPINNYAELD